MLSSSLTSQWVGVKTKYNLSTTIWDDILLLGLKPKRGSHFIEFVPDVTTMDLNVRGKVPGLDQAGFENATQQAEQGCPVSNALRNNVQISVKAHLES